MRALSRPPSFNFSRGMTKEESQWRLIIEANWSNKAPPAPCSTRNIQLIYPARSEFRRSFPLCRSNEEQSRVGPVPFTARAIISTTHKFVR